jgi:hypothetical protein
MFARYYSSGLARFLAVDPGNDTSLEGPQTWNKYAYVRNNPILYNDPKGTCVWDFCIAEVAVAAAIVGTAATILAAPAAGGGGQTNGEVIANSLIEVGDAVRGLVNHLTGNQGKEGTDASTGTGSEASTPVGSSRAPMEVEPGTDEPA